MAQILIHVSARQNLAYVKKEITNALGYELAGYTAGLALILVPSQKGTDEEIIQSIDLATQELKFELGRSIRPKTRSEPHGKSGGS